MSNSYSPPAVAARYNAARALPEETKTQWLNALKSSLPHSPARILDLGCGTGRFTADLHKVFTCPVVGVDPSAAMLDVARSTGAPGVEWRQGSAETIPAESGFFDLVFMAQVWHHLPHPEVALKEIRRVLAPGGFLAIRNGTQETDAQIAWFHCFPEAQELDRKRIPTREKLETTVCGSSFTLLSRQTLSQFFTGSYREYVEKIGHRGLSVLIAISDDAFDRGMARLREWADQQPEDVPVPEPVDVFLFQKAE